jgi:hypothetical protein
LLPLLPATPALALDKQGSAHGGSIAGATQGIHVSGALMAGVSLYNPSYAARPDNTGRTLMRYAAHGDLELIGRRLSVPVDLNLFTDRDRDGVRKLGPTELDGIVGLTSTWEVGPGALEVGTRFEHDRPVDRGGASQSYVDVRARYLYSLAAALPGLAPALRDGDVSGWVTLGWFAHNPSYFARPDNTGRALLRYALHAELSLWQDTLSVGLDGTLFSDRRADNPLRPSELDLTPELILRRRDFEVHIAYERDMPLDRSGLVQHFVYLLGVWSFSLGSDPGPFEDRGQILSP